MNLIWNDDHIFWKFNSIETMVYLTEWIKLIITRFHKAMRDFSTRTIYIFEKRAKKPNIYEKIVKWYPPLKLLCCGSSIVTLDIKRYGIVSL